MVAEPVGSVTAAGAFDRDSKQVIGARAVVKRHGDVEMAVNDALVESDLDEGLILACQARPKSDVVELNYDD